VRVLVRTGKIYTGMIDPDGDVPPEDSELDEGDR